jgi:hypothetical protein
VSVVAVRWIPDGRRPFDDEAGSVNRDLEEAMKAAVGDRLIVHGHHLGEPERDAEIIAVLGEAGEPPFKVRWSDDGHVSELFPGSDASVEHFEHRTVKPARTAGRVPRPPV